MTKLSDGDTLPDLVGTELFPVISTPGVAGGNDKIDAATAFLSTAAQSGISARLATALLAGANVTITDNGNGTFTITAGAASAYTDENAIDAIAGVLTQDPGFTIITYDDNANGGVGAITVAVDPAFKARLSGLIEVGDQTTSSAASVRLPGTAGAYVSATTNAGQIVAGNLILTMRVDLDDWTPGTVMSPFAIDGGAGNIGFHVNITTAGMIQLVHSVDGTATSSPASTVAPAPTDGTVIWLKIFRDASDGTTDFSWAPDSPTEPTVWTSLSTNRASTLGNTFDSTATPTVGIGNTSGINVMTGHALRAILRFGLGTSTPTVDFNPASWTSGSSWVSTTGETWTLQGTASMVGGGSNTVSNSAAQFDLAAFSAHPEVPLVAHDCLMVFAQAWHENTSGANANFSYDVQVNGVTLFTIPATALGSSASNIRTMTFSLRLVMPTNAGDAMFASMELAISLATAKATAPNLGSLTAAAETIHFNAAAYVTSALIPAFTTVPVIKLRCTMTAATTVSTTRGLRQLFVAKA